MLKRALLCSCACLGSVLLVSCGGGSGGGDDPVVAPTPTPTPTPPVPTPTPTFTPNPARLLGQAGIGQAVTGPVACADGTLTNDAAGRANGIASLGAATLGTGVRIEVRAADTYALTLNGTSGPVFDPADKAAGPTRAYDYFRDGGDEIELYRGALGAVPFFSTLGRYSFSGASDRLCFFAAGGPGVFVNPSAFIRTPFEFVGIADGVAQISGTDSRLFGSRATATVDYTQGSIIVRLNTEGSTPVFGEIADADSSNLPNLTGTAIIDASGGFLGTITGTSGLTGSFRGQLFDNSPTALVFAFQLQQINGNKVFGAAALDAQL